MMAGRLGVLQVECRRSAIIFGLSLLYPQAQEDSAVNLTPEQAEKDILRHERLANAGHEGRIARYIDRVAQESAVEALWANLGKYEEELSRVGSRSNRASPSVMFERCLVDRRVARLCELLDAQPAAEVRTWLAKQFDLAMQSAERELDRDIKRFTSRKPVGSFQSLESAIKEYSESAVKEAAGRPNFAYRRATIFVLAGRMDDPGLLSDMTVRYLQFRSGAHQKCLDLKAEMDEFWWQGLYLNVNCGYLEAELLTNVLVNAGNQQFHVDLASIDPMIRVEHSKIVQCRWDAVYNANDFPVQSYGIKPDTSNNLGEYTNYYIAEHLRDDQRFEVVKNVLQAYQQVAGISTGTL